MGFGKSIKKAVKKVEKPFRSVGGLLTGGTLGAVLGGALGSVIPVVGTTIGATLGGAIGGSVGSSYDAAKAQSKAAKLQNEGYAQMADALKSQPTANASLVADAAATQNEAKVAEEQTQNAKKRRMGWGSTVNSSLGSSGLGGRLTL